MIGKIPILNQTPNTLWKYYENIRNINLHITLIKTFLHYFHCATKFNFSNYYGEFSAEYGSRTKIRSHMYQRFERFH